MIAFYEQGHIYKSLDESAPVNWLGVTTLIKNLHEPFDAQTKAFETSMRKPTKLYPNKWYGIPPSEIDAAWKAEGDRASALGHWYHGKREFELLGQKERHVFMSNIVNGVKYSFDLALGEGIYPELLIYLLSAGLCGQADYVEIRDGVVYIRDYKTSKEIKRKGFTNYHGTKMMYHPIDHLEDCEYNHYAIQLSLYMYMLLRHNPNLMPGTLIIEHIKFVKESEDKYGYPIYKKDAGGNFIVKEIEEIEVPYLKKEVQSILEWLKTNKQKIQQQ